MAKRCGAGHGSTAAWEASASYGSVAEEHDGEEETTRLWNVALRHGLDYGFGAVYGLLEVSRSEPEHEEGYFSVLAEAQVGIGIHQPYVRIEYATRPEYPRDGVPGSDRFFRYDHHAEAADATRWTIVNLGYNLVAIRGAVSLRPFVNAQYHAVDPERGLAAMAPGALFGADRFLSVSLGARLFFGGDPMRMGSYGVLDAMTAMNRMMHPGRPMPGTEPRHRGH